MANPGSATFFSELRRGAALGITRVDQAAAPPEPRALLDVHVNYDSNHDAATQLPLVGPGDIVGLDTRTIVRTFPKPDDNDAESDFLAYVELDQADFLWRYTPAKPQGAIPLKTDRLRPWLTLIVLEEGTEFSDSDLAPPTGTAKLPLLTINDVSLLTILTDAWAWGHVHVQGDVTEAQLPGLLAGRPGTVVARLMSPRRLEKQKAYRAFLVPTFRRGASRAAAMIPARPTRWSRRGRSRRASRTRCRSITRGAFRRGRSARSTRRRDSCSRWRCCLPASASATSMCCRPASICKTRSAAPG